MKVWLKIAEYINKRVYKEKFCLAFYFFITTIDNSLYYVVIEAKYGRNYFP